MGHKTKEFLLLSLELRGFSATFKAFPLKSIHKLFGTCSGDSLYT